MSFQRDFLSLLLFFLLLGIRDLVMEVEYVFRVSMSMSRIGERSRSQLNVFHKKRKIKFHSVFNDFLCSLFRRLTHNPGRERANSRIAKIKSEKDFRNERDLFNAYQVDWRDMAHSQSKMGCNTP